MDDEQVYPPSNTADEDKASEKVSFTKLQMDVMDALCESDGNTAATAAKLGIRKDQVQGHLDAVRVICRKARNVNRQERRWSSRSEKVKKRLL